MSHEKEEAEPWVRAGYTEEHEDELIGNRAGFELLRRKIDEVVQTGRAPLEEGGLEWVALKIVAEDPHNKKSGSRVQDLFALVAFGVVIVFALFVFVVGFGTLWSWWS